MALDHARLYFGYGTYFADPTNLNTTTPFVFFTRWITNFCAPVFIFLAGTAAYLYGSRRKSITDVSRFLLTRGLWLVAVEVIIVNFGWMFDITYSVVMLQVIWVIGISMVFLSFVVFLPRVLIFALGLIMVIGHNCMDAITVAGISVTSVFWYIVHQKAFVPFGSDFAIIFLYPLIPWIGVMALGYVFGTIFHEKYDPAKRKMWLLWLGTGSITLFLLLRILNLYGEPSDWGPQESLIYSLMSFLNTTKYPASLLFLLMTLGPAMIVLYLVENIRNSITRALIVFGRVPFFFYIIHIYLIHLLGVLAIMYIGRSAGDMILTAKAFMAATLANYGFDVYVSYIVWVLVTILLYPICRIYSNYKSENRSKWWLSYL
jgi:uncharacterized membrane protein